MPIKYKVNCKTCRLSRENPKIRQRIYYAYFKRDEQEETIKDIAREVGIDDAAIYRHCKNHITIAPIKNPVQVEKHIQELKAKIAKETELALDHDSVVPKEDYERVLDGVLAEGLAQMKTNGKTITISQLLTAAKIKGDFQAKKRGQDIEVIKSMYRFSSGNKNGTTPRTATSTS